MTLELGEILLYCIAVKRLFNKHIEPKQPDES